MEGFKEVKSDERLHKSHLFELDRKFLCFYFPQKNGRYISDKSKEGSLQIYDIKRGKVFPEKLTNICSHKGYEFCPNKRCLYVKFDDKSIQMYDTKNGAKKVFEEKLANVIEHRFGLDNRYFVAFIKDENDPENKFFQVYDLHRKVFCRIKCEQCFKLHQNHLALDLALINTSKKTKEKAECRANFYRFFDCKRKEKGKRLEFLRNKSNVLEMMSAHKLSTKQDKLGAKNQIEKAIEKTDYVNFKEESCVIL